MTTFSPTRAEWEAATDLPSAARLLARTIRNERSFSAGELTRLEEYPPEHRASVRLNHERMTAMLEEYESQITQSLAIWHEEMDAVRDRIIARIKEEVPRSEETGIYDAIESGDYSLLEI